MEVSLILISFGLRNWRLLVERSTLCNTGETWVRSRGGLYAPRVKWSDVAINGVPLEQTFEFEDNLRLEEERSDPNEEKQYIMMNSRPSQPLPY